MRCVGQTRRKRWAVGVHSEWHVVTSRTLCDLRRQRRYLHCAHAGPATSTDDPPAVDAIRSDLPDRLGRDTTRVLHHNTLDGEVAQ